ncbi:hypothetical protein [Jannaschia seohaensis]|nr:hypothetical protein [Jannaschia seohaensis]
MARTEQGQLNLVALHDRIAEAEEELSMLDEPADLREKAREIDLLHRALAQEVAALRDLG